MDTCTLSGAYLFHQHVRISTEASWWNTVSVSLGEIAVFVKQNPSVARVFWTTFKRFETQRDKGEIWRFPPILHLVSSSRGISLKPESPKSRFLVSPDLCVPPGFVRDAAMRHFSIRDVRLDSSFHNAPKMPRSFHVSLRFRGETGSPRRAALMKFNELRMKLSPLFLVR